MTTDLPEHVSSSYGVAQPWERQIKEDERAWDLFRRYRELPYPDGYAGEFRGRRLAELGQLTGVSVATLKGLSASFLWEERAGAYDREIERRRFEQGLSAAERTNLQHQRILAKVAVIVEQQMERLLQKSTAGEELTTRESVALAEWQFKSSRLVTGQSTENVAVAHAWNLDLLELDERLELKRLAEKAGAIPKGS